MEKSRFVSTHFVECVPLTKSSLARDYNAQPRALLATCAVPIARCTRGICDSRFASVLEIVALLDPRDWRYRVKSAVSFSRLSTLAEAAAHAADAAPGGAALRAVLTRET